MNNFYPKLTGGTFFILLLQSKRIGVDKKIQITGVPTELADFELLEGLLKLAQSSHCELALSTMKNNTAQFKNCDKWCTSWLPFQDQSFIDEFNTEFKANYPSMLTRMEQFFNNFLDISNKTKMNKLGRSILELIALDKSIDESSEFFINSPVIGIKKKDLTPETNYALQPLILGVWLYIVQHKIDNKLGKDTFLNWHDSPRVRGQKWVFKSTIGGDKYQNTIITLISDSDIKLDKTKADNENHLIDYNFSNYLSLLKKKYSTITTFIYNHEPKPFDCFYVCNDLALSSKCNPIKDSFFYNYIDDNYKIKNATILKIVSNFSNFIIITGTGGLGKTMMLNHLLLDCIESFNKNYFVPIFLKLREVNSQYTSFFDFAYSSIKNLCTITESQFTQLLSTGKVVFLLDGLDEIKTEYINKFQKMLEIFTDRFSDNIFIMSTRPNSVLGVFSRFKQLVLLPLSKEQSILLIKKLDFRPDEPSIKNNFIEKLNSSLYFSHLSFANNPLLLTIMLITFEYYKDIPSKMYKFYQEAYNALLWKHDKTKVAFKRQWKTNIDSDTYEEYLNEFSFRTYYKELFEFSYDEGKYIFDNMKVCKKYNQQNIKFNPFIQDLQKNLCLLLLDGTKYRFSHRSFQEFFCAKYLANKNDSDFYDIGLMFNANYNRSNSDQTFSMLEAMKPEKVEQFIFFPFINNLIADCTSREGLKTFIINHFKNIFYSVGDFDESYTTCSSTYLLKYIMKKYNLSSLESLDEYLDSAPIYDEFIYERYYYVDSYSESDKSQLVKESSLKDDLSNLSNDDCAGFNLEIKTDILFENNNVYNNLINLLLDNYSPFNKLYKSLIDLLDKFKSKYQFNIKDSLFDRL